MNRRIGMMLVLLTSMLLAGCANAYNCYSCGAVNCSYCPPSAMAWFNSPNCNCENTPGQAYLARKEGLLSMQANSDDVSSLVKNKIVSSPLLRKTQ